MTEETNTQTYGSEVGNVLWFDQKKGFGFVKVITPGSEFLNKEIFVHYSSIQSQNSFKKLYPGENVSLDVVKNTGVENGKEYNSSNITGLYGSQLLVDNASYIVKIIKRRTNTEIVDGEGQ